MLSKRSEVRTVIYTPESPLKHPREFLRTMVHDLKVSFALARRLTVRDISAQYRQTLLGYLWTILPPLVTSMVWIFLNYSQVVVVRSTDVPYPVYAFAGTVFWQLFMDALNAPLTQVNSNRALISKINFPKEALVLSGIAQVLFSFVIKLAFLIGILLLFEIKISWTVLLLIFPIVGLLLAGTTIGMFLVPVGFLYKDIQNGLVITLGLLIYITPVVYPLPETGLLATLMNSNPLTPLLMTARDLLYKGAISFSKEFFIVIGITLLTTLICWIVYRLALPIIAERMDA